jgi:drug/metabolite transporter (DMT)-like permease
MPAPAPVIPASAPRARWGSSDALMLLVITIWAVNLTSIKLGLSELAPHAFNGLRLVVAAVVYIAVLALTGRKLRVERDEVLPVVLLGILGITAYQLVFIHGISLTTAISAAMINALAPIFTAILSTTFFGERLSRVNWLGILISFAGFVLLIAPRKGGGLPDRGLEGAVFILVANVLWALYTVYMKPAVARIEPLRLAGLSTIAGAALYLPFAAADMKRIPWSALTLQAWGSVFFSGLLAIVLCFFLWSVSVRKVGSARTGVYGFLTPVIASGVAAAVLGETFGLSELGAALVIFFGVWLSRAGNSRKA